MDKAEIRFRLDEERRSLQRAGEVLESLPQVARLRSADGGQHSVVFSSLDAESADQVIDEQIEYYRTLGVGFEWKVYSHDPPTDLLNRLKTRGFEMGHMETVLVYDL